MPYKDPRGEPFEIEIIIDRQGNFTSTTKGIKGGACTDASSWLDDLGEVTSDCSTQEMYERQDVQTVRSR